ncbi:MAG: GGDEF domain-containing protein [Oscillospiraceae bacterium]|nr:GGDEF domain-containing protein [Oscillospiraceae bacterium]
MKIRNIAVIVIGLDEEYQYNVIRGINQYARDNNVNVTYFAAFPGVVVSKKFDIGEFSIFNLTNFSYFDGALLMLNTFSNSELKERIVSRVRASGIPAVTFETKDYPEFYDISIDNFKVMKELTNHVIQVHGAKVINYVSGPLSNPEGRTRYNAFLSAMKENSLHVDERRIFHGSFRGYDGKLAADDFAESGLPLPDAFICANDSMALTLITSLRQMGYSVPEDTIVTGFDDSFIAKNSSPELTSVSRPLYESGYQACDKLCRLLNGENQPRSTEISAAPVYRESCGCPRSADEDIRENQKQTFSRLERTNANILTLNRLTAGLASAETTAENMDVIASVLNDIDCEKFCLCLTADWQEAFSPKLPPRDPNVYCDYMTAPLIWERTGRRSVPIFKSSEMFPEPPRTGGNIYYFLPLHFGDRCLGYYIITNGNFAINSLLCHTLTMNISNSIENIRKLFHLNRAMEELNRLYVIDPLCDIYNRNGFINLAEEMFRESVRKGESILLSFIDMDGLKFINDNYGHNEGDFAIRQLAEIIKACTDTHGIAARIGGDEFVIFAKNAGQDAADALADRFNHALAECNLRLQKPYLISASIGSIVNIANENDTLYSMIQRADDKMYEIKKFKKSARKSEAVSE